MHSLDEFSDGARNLIASVICGRPVNVVLSSRVAAAVVAASTRTIVLQHWCGLRDLILCARLLRHRQRVRRRKKLAANETKYLVRDAISDLSARFPGFRRLRGILDEELPPEFVWDRISFQPLERGFTPEIASTPGVEVAGSDDFDVLLRAMRRGDVPTVDVRGLKEMPVATLPLRVHVADQFPMSWERVLEIHGEAAMREWTEGVLACQLASLEGLRDESVAPRRRHTGVRLDMTRLHDAAVGHRTGRPAALFRKPHEDNDVFRPEQHFAVLGFDPERFSGFA